MRRWPSQPRMWIMPVVWVPRGHEHGPVAAPAGPDASPWAGFGAALRTLRVDRRLSQAQLGRVVHVSGDLIGKIEKAERRPQPDVVARLDRALGADGRLIDSAAELAISGRGASAAMDAGRGFVPPEALTPELLAGVREVLAGCRRLDHVLGPAV